MGEPREKRPMGTTGATRPLDDTMAVFDGVTPGTPLTTSEVTAELACTRRTTYNRLQRLVERDTLRTKKVGASGRVWWQPPQINDEHPSVDETDRDRPQTGGDQPSEIHSGVSDREDWLPSRWAEISPGPGTATEPTSRTENRASRGRLDTETPHRDAGTPHRDAGSLDPSSAGRERKTGETSGSHDAVDEDLADVFDRITDGFFALDENWRFTYLNERAERILGHRAEDLVGTQLFEAFPAAKDNVFSVYYREALVSNDPVDFEAYSELANGWLKVHAYPSETGLSVYFRDVTKHKMMERELRAREQKLQHLAAHLEDVVWMTTPEKDEMLYVNPAYEEVWGRSRKPLYEDPTSFLEGIHPADLERVRKAISDQPAGSYDEEYRVVQPDGTVRWVRDRAVPVCDENGEVYRIVGTTQDVTDRIERQRELERQRERLAALNGLNAVVREINEAVIDHSTREEIEETVCEALAGSDSYTFAWTAEVDPHTHAVVPRAEAGVSGYLDEIELSANPQEPIGRGPVGQAVRAGDVQVSTNVFEDPDFEPWREYAEAYGYRSFAAIPIIHQESLYGMLGVYSEREGAFVGEERAVVSQLGEIVGHAIAAVDRKRALMGDEHVEVAFRIPDIFEAMDCSIRTDERLTFDRTIPIGEDQYLQYGTGNEEAVETLKKVAEELPHMVDLTILDEGPGLIEWELRLDSPGFLSKIASLGGRIDRAVIEDGDYHATIHLPPGVDTRQVIEAVRENHATFELVSRVGITKTEGPGRLHSLEPDLTECQRTTLEAAYYAGFYDWPRNSTGEDLADSLGVSPPTFHQHLRLGTKRVLKTLFEG